MEIPLSPTGKKEIHQLESMLLFATLFRPEVIEMIKNPVERLTWVDSLSVAAGAIAREKARMTTGEIAEELGRTEQTIRKHLKGETKAGKLVRETYELVKKGKLDDILKTLEMMERKDEMISREEHEKSLNELRQKLSSVLQKISEARSELEKIIATPTDNQKA